MFIEAMQDWITREIQTDRDPEREVGGDAGELWKKGEFEVAFKEMKIVSEYLLQEGESMDKNSHIMSRETTEEIRILEQQEIVFWRGSASRRHVGWTRHGSIEEIRQLDVGSTKIQQRSGSEEAELPRGGREGICERCQKGRRFH